MAPATGRAGGPAGAAVLALIAGLLGAPPAPAQISCTITQVTDTTGFGCRDPSLDAGSIAFASTSDVTGANPDGSFEIFLFDGSRIVQVTDAGPGPGSLAPSLDNGSIAFASRVDLTSQDRRPLHNQEIFLFDGSSIRQITSSRLSRDSGGPSLDGGSIAFSSVGDFTGENPGAESEIFYFDGTTFRQITDTTSGGGSSFSPSLDGGSIAFWSSTDLTGNNPQSRPQIFLFDGTDLVQITDSEPGTYSRAPSLDGGSIAFESTADLTGDNPDGNSEIFLFDGSSIRQITDTVDATSYGPSLDGGNIAFSSSADLTGGNPDRNYEVFVFDGTAFTQITDTEGAQTPRPSLDGQSIAFHTAADLTGGNPDGNLEIFLATCPALAPPPGPYLVSDELPDFRFKVRITAGEETVAGVREADCIGETLCVSGALPGRSELFVRVIGPRLNGFLWTNLVRFTPSRVQVWAEQISTGTMRYYDLPSLSRGDPELTGLVDKQAFPTGGAAAAGPLRVASRSQGRRPAPVAGLLAPATFTSDAFPGFRFTVRILAGGDEQPVRVESDCLPETVCVSGALPGRSELFLRIFGPRPNGLLWTNLVRFTTSRVEVEIEQLTTGVTRTYVLEAVPRGSDALNGRVDSQAFTP